MSTERVTHARCDLRAVFSEPASAVCGAVAAFYFVRRNRYCFSCVRHAAIALAEGYRLMMVDNPMNPYIPEHTTDCMDEETGPCLSP